VILSAKEFKYMYVQGLDATRQIENEVIYKKSKHNNSSMVLTCVHTSRDP
jgi:hypothetical protein